MPGERPALVSGRYPLTPDPLELQRCVLEHARDLDRNVDHHKAHSWRLQELEKTSKAVDERLDRLSAEFAGLARQVKLITAVGAGATTLAVTVAIAAFNWVLK